MSLVSIEACSIFAEGLDHPEGIAFHKDGSLWAGGEAGQIYRMDLQGHVTKVADTGGFILGLAFSPGCEWLAICDLGKKCVWRLDPSTYQLSLFAEGAQGHRFNIPNYAVFDRQGNLYVSESGAFRQEIGKVLKFKPNGVGEVWHPGPLNFANGMALSPDEQSLFVVTSFLPGVERISILEDGSAGPIEVYCTLPKTVPDGIAFDNEGNLYVSCYTPNTIFKVTPSRNVVEFVHDWDAHTLTNPTNLAFGGADGRTMFAANLGRWHITSIPAGVKGLPLVGSL
jgi:gluconolactonase